MLDGIDRLAPARACAPRRPRPWRASDEPVEPFAIALATRDLLVDAAEDAPIVVFVDDLPWVDLPTRRTLSYIARRLQFERLAIVSTRRVGTDAHTDTGPALRSTGVTDDVADAILRDAGVTSAGVRRELIAAGGGIPLVLVEAANLLDADQRPAAPTSPTRCRSARPGQRVVDLVLERLAAGRAVGAARRRGRARRRPRADPQGAARARSRRVATWRWPRQRASSRSTAIA